MKKDKELGLKVSEHLIKLGIETPMVPTPLTVNEKIDTVSGAIRHSMECLGLDLTDDSLMDTPNRVAKMWVTELFAGLDYANFPKITVIDNKMGCDEMVLVKDISAHSNCEHHFVQVLQRVSIAYIPSDKIVGLSKLARIAKFFAQRPEVQERYCAQVFETVKFLLQTEHVAVSVVGQHGCMRVRGVEDENSSTVTNKLSGLFKTDPAARAEFFKSIDLCGKF